MLFIALWNINITLCYLSGREIKVNHYFIQSNPGFNYLILICTNNNNLSSTYQRSCTYLLGFGHKANILPDVSHNTINKTSFLAIYTAPHRREPKVHLRHHPFPHPSFLPSHQWKSACLCGDKRNMMWIRQTIQYNGSFFHWIPKYSYLIFGLARS